MLDLVVRRSEMKDALIQILSILMHRKPQLDRKAIEVKK